MTSLLEPDPVALGFFSWFSKFGAVEKVETVQTQRMDDVAGLPDIDFAKMDIQGAELTVLQNGTERLAGCWPFNWKCRLSRSTRTSRVLARWTCGCARKGICRIVFWM